MEIERVVKLNPVTAAICRFKNISVKPYCPPDIFIQEKNIEQAISVKGMNPCVSIICGFADSFKSGNKSGI